jgi:DNA-directed RNA polymerase subunit RPC12/RpoP
MKRHYSKKTAGHFLVMALVILAGNALAGWRVDHNVDLIYAVNRNADVPLPTRGIITIPYIEGKLEKIGMDGEAIVMTARVQIMRPAGIAYNPQVAKDGDAYLFILYFDDNPIGSAENPDPRRHVVKGEKLKITGTQQIKIENIPENANYISLQLWTSETKDPEAPIGNTWAQQQVKKIGACGSGGQLHDLGIIANPMRTVATAPDAENTMKCPKCDGAGRIRQEAETVNCPNCDGKGFYYSRGTTGLRMNCMRCDGKGKESRPARVLECPYCKGSGAVLKE